MQPLPCTASMIVLGDILLLSYSKTRLVTVSLERGANEGRSKFHCKPPADNKNCWLGSSEPPAGPEPCCTSSCETIVGAETRTSENPEQTETSDPASGSENWIELNWTCASFPHAPACVYIVSVCICLLSLHQCSLVNICVSLLFILRSSSPM